MKDQKNLTHPTIRIDKWLWYARFFKTRTLSGKLVTAGHVRVNSDKVHKAAAAIGPGDTLTFPQGRQIRVIRVIDIGTRRGPASEAQTLYEDLSPAPQQSSDRTPLAQRSGRPTKQDRRAVVNFKKRGLEDGPD